MDTNRQQTPAQMTKPEWSGDLNCDCTARWAGLTLLAKKLGEAHWRWFVCDNALEKEANEVRSSVEDNYCSCFSGEMARNGAEQAARQYLRLKSGASALSSLQRQQLQNWLKESGEFWVDVYVAHSGASSTDYFVRSIEDIEELISKQTGGDLQVCIFRRIQYSLRGAADEALLAKALDMIPDGQWYHILSLDHYYPSACEGLGCDDTHAQLRLDFSKIIGKRVAVGQNPFDVLDDKWIYSMPDEVMVLNFKYVSGKYVPE